CGGGGADANMKEQVAVTKEMMEATKSMNLAKMQEHAARLKQLQEEFAKFPAEEQKAAHEKYDKELAAAMGFDIDKMKAGFQNMMPGAGAGIPGIPTDAGNRPAAKPPAD